VVATAHARAQLTLFFESDLICASLLLNQGKCGVRKHFQLGKTSISNAKAIVMLKQLTM
jgi:hypothetical protein